MIPQADKKIKTNSGQSEQNLNPQNLDKNQDNILAPISQDSHPSSSQTSLRLSQRERKKIQKQSLTLAQNNQRVGEIVFKTGKKTQIVQILNPSIMVCSICQQKHLVSQMKSISDCQHLFCNFCLKSYANYKLNVFEIPPCPFENCDKTIQITSNLYKELNKQMKVRLEKIVQIESVLNDKTKKTCPDYNCLGVISLKTNKTNKTECPSCSKSYCRLCWQQWHKNNCDDHVAKKLQMNHGYKKCNKCGSIVERAGGCEHMKCKCHYQFCYLCGNQWKSGHLCPPPQVPEGLTTIQELNWMLSNRADCVKFFHLSPSRYINFVTSITENGDFTSIKAMLYITILYPLTTILWIIHLFYVFIGIHIFFLLLFFIFNPCWTIQVCQQFRIFSKIDTKCLKIIFLIIVVLFYPVLFGFSVIFCFGYFWMCNCNQRFGIYGTIKKQLKGNLTLLLAPCLAYARTHN